MRQAYINLHMPFTQNNAFIIEDGHFTLVGRKGTILRQNIDEIIDLQDKTILPAFHDSHMHLLGLGWQRSIFDVAKLNSIEAIQATGKKRPEQFIMGRGFHEQTTEEKRSLNKQDLDAISTEKPIVIYRACGHVLFANSKAIEMALALQPKFTSEWFDEGIFKEEDMDFIKAIFPTPSLVEIKGYILNAQAHLLKNGITSVGSDDYHIFETVPYETVKKAFKTLVDEGRLKLNVLEQVNLPKIADLKDYLKKGYAHESYGTFTEGPLKLLADGSLGGHSAYMKAPYADKDTKGIEIFNQAALKERIELARSKRMDFAIHAIGDQTAETIIDIKASFNDDPLAYRDSIIHAQLCDTAQIKRMGELNLGAQTQPIFLNSDIPIIEERLGARAQKTYLFNTMINEGVLTTLSTDAPIEDVNPFENLYAATTRKSIKHPDYPPFLKEEAIPIRQALKAYTITPAYFAYKSKKIGAIKKGYEADFIVVDHFNPQNPKSFLKTDVLKTFHAGRCVFEKA